MIMFGGQVLGTALQLLQALYLLNVGSSMRRVCYLTNWAQYRNTPIKFTPGNLHTLIEPHLCSHIILAFLDVKQGAMQMREHNDGEIIDVLVEMKHRNPDLKIMVAIGGWNAGTEPFTYIMESEERMQQFNLMAIKFLRENKLDGLDVDIEYPANRGSPPEDRKRFTTWMRMLAKDFEKESYQSRKPRLILSGAVGVGKKVIDTAYDIEEIDAAFDFMSLMTYDFNGAWQGWTGHNAPIRHQTNDPRQENLSVDWAVNYWLSNGASSLKVNLGIPAYGRSYALCPNATELKTEGVGAPACSPGPSGIYTGEPGVNAYFETCLKEQCDAEVGKHLYELFDDDLAEAPFMYSRRANDWVSTENVESVAAKARYAVEHHLGGIALWTLDFDDCADLCGHGTQPLLRAINKAIDIGEHHQHDQHHHRNKRLQLDTSGFVNPCERLIPPTVLADSVAKVKVDDTPSPPADDHKQPQ